MKGEIVVAKESALTELKIPHNNRIAIKDGYRVEAVNKEWVITGQNIAEHFYGLSELEGKIAQIENLEKKVNLLSRTVAELTELISC